MRVPRSQAAPCSWAPACRGVAASSSWRRSDRRRDPLVALVVIDYAGTAARKARFPDMVSNRYVGALPAGIAVVALLTAGSASPASSARAPVVKLVARAGL